MLSERWGDLWLYQLILFIFPVRSRQSGVYVFSSRPLGPVEEEGGLELTRTALHSTVLSAGRMGAGLLFQAIRNREKIQ